MRCLHSTFIILSVIISHTATVTAAIADDEIMANTFSIVAADPETGEVGVAVATRLPAVGMYVPFAEAGVGAVASQAIVNPEYGPACLKLLKAGVAPADVVTTVTGADPRRADRQLSVITPDGRAASFTGEANSQACGHLVGKNCAVAGNLLVSTATIIALRDTFENTQGRLSDRMLAALEAGEKAGGDQRGKQSAAILVVRPGAYFNGKVVDLRVDDDPHPIQQLHKIYRTYMSTFLNLPGYRDIVAGTSGPDIKRLNTWLAALSQADTAALISSGDTCTSATEAALHHFLGTGETLSLTPADSYRLQRAAHK